MNAVFSIVLAFLLNTILVSGIAIEPRPRIPDSLCQYIKLWKKLMREEYPASDRLVPGAAASCMIADD